MKSQSDTRQHSAQLVLPCFVAYFWRADGCDEPLPASYISIGEPLLGFCLLEEAFDSLELAEL